MSETYDRDLVGYGAHPPNPNWPGEARLAINFVMNYEEGSEPSVQDGESFTETGLTDAQGVDSGVNGRDLAGEGMFAYGSRVGFWRLMRLFQERQLPLTIFGCALAIERNPQAAQAIRTADFDVCCHGWRWVKHYLLTEAQERQHIRLAVASLAKAVGARPLGWYCRYGPSVNTRRLVTEEGGFLYDWTPTTTSCHIGRLSRANHISSFPIPWSTMMRNTPTERSPLRTTISRSTKTRSTCCTRRAARIRK